MPGFAIIVLFLAEHANWATCPATAALEGDQSLVSEVREILSSRGVPQGSATECGALSIVLEARQSRIQITIADASGERAVREAHGALGAATIIESWVRADLEAPLLDREALEEQRKPFRPEEPVYTETNTSPGPALQPRPFTLSFGPVVGLASDASTWSGVEARGCVRLWQLCLGGRFQYALDLAQGGDAAALGGSRSLLDLGLTVELPVTLEAVELIPGLAIGHANLNSHRMAGLVPIEDDAPGLRLRAQLGGSWRFSTLWSARIDTAIDFEPFAQNRLFESTTTHGPENFALPGEPSFIGWIRLAIEAGEI
jgi:hypothetical protein